MNTLQAGTVQPSTLLLFEQTSVQKKIELLLKTKRKCERRQASECTQETNPLQCLFTYIAFIIFSTSFMKFKKNSRISHKVICIWILF